MTPARIVMLEEQFQELRDHVFDYPGCEGGAFLLCGQSRTDQTQKLTCRRVVPIAENDYLYREPARLSIAGRALSRITKMARAEALSIVFVHSHPEGPADFSGQDDCEEQRLLPFLAARLPDQIHGTIVVSPDGMVGRLYTPDQCSATILVFGARFQVHHPGNGAGRYQAFDRQVRAFGKSIQETISELRVGVVGLGGTGSAVAEMLCRIGVRELLLFDGDVFETSNINRIYGSTISDHCEFKVDIAKRHLDAIGLSASVRAIPQHITFEHSARQLRDCDIVFGCTDKQLPRAILVQIAMRYLLPVFDMGVLIDSANGTIGGVYGRVTTLMPGEACLLCRGRISPNRMRLEALSPTERERQIREGYAPELELPAPAVIPFTTATAAFALSEWLNRLTGFMGTERESTEVLVSFDRSRIRTNRLGSQSKCLCADRGIWGAGDDLPFLGMTWPNSPN
jgi:molybdopterin/thiamine biosynthesis adenylyltransferase